MKFHYIEIENINSLYGTHKIHLERDFQDVPVYLIMGPTGSGKTTILDAVCLALFGSTPRQTDAPGGASGVAEMVNSHGTWRSKALVEFSLLDANQRTHRRYRATWRFERTYKKPSGSAKTPRRELQLRRPDGSWGPDVLVSSSKNKEYAPVFDRVLDGMTLDDFLRSVMLAQGAFAALLSAKAEEKAAILERITDTSAYQKMGVLAYERMKEEEGRLRELEHKIGDVEDVSEEALEAARAKLAQAQEDAKKLERCSDSVGARYDWLKRELELGEAADKAAQASKEAEREREANADEMARVELHAQAEPAGEAIRDLQRYKDEQKLNAEKLPLLLEALNKSKAQLEAARSAEAEAQAGLNAVEDALKAQEPQIRAARDAQKDQKNAQAELAQAQATAQGYEAKQAAAQAGVDRAIEAVEAAAKTREALAERLEKNAEHQLIAAKLPFIQADQGTLEGALKKRESQQQKKAQLRAVLAEKEGALEALNERVEAQKEKVAPLQKSVDAAKQLLEELLGDADLARERRAEIDAEINTYQARLARLQEWLKYGEERLQKREECKDLEERYASEKKEVLAYDKTLEERNKERADIADEIARVERALTQTQQGLWAIKLREELHQGQDCPVCGSLEHPIGARDGADATNEQEAADLARMQTLEAERDALLERDAAQLEKIEALKAPRDKAALAAAEAKTRLSMAEEALTKLDVRILELGEALDLGAQALHDDREAFETQYETLSQQYTQKIADLNALKTRLDEAEDGVEAAKNNAEAHHKKLQTLEQEQRDAGMSLELERKNLAALEDELKEMAVQIKKSRDGLCALFSEIGIIVDQNAAYEPDFEAAFALATQWRDAWDKNKAALDAAKEAAREAEAALNERRIELKSAQARLQEAEEALEKSRAKLAAADQTLAERLAPFEGKTLAEVEAFYKEQIESARALKQARVDARQQAELALKDAQNAHEHTEKTLKKLAEDLGQTRAKLADIIEQIAAENPKLSTLEAVSEALLEGEELKQLKAIYTRIQQAVRDAKIESERVAKARKAHGTDRPEGFEAALYSLEGLEQARERLKQALSEKHTASGRLTGELQELEGKMSDLLEYQKEFEAQKIAFDGWKELNELIGTSSGKRFKEFAQALHLDRIVARANHHLRELRPRYTLRTKRDGDSHLPTLDFEIVDKKAADSSRPLSTLSGGETFLVSLALALALADQQQIRVPMETLFLDEGFGTLDRESLQQAMETLQHLHASVGRTVVVISHVEALKDKIAHQIVVTPELSGRSKIEIPNPA